jgi:hypothetical protein
MDKLGSGVLYAVRGPDATIDELLEAVFSRWSAQRLYH